MHRPRWKAHLHVEVLNGSTVLLFDEADYTILAGDVYALLAPLLDGTRTRDEIVEALDTRMLFVIVEQALDNLERAGHVIAADEAPPALSAFWHALGVDTATASSVLGETSVRVDSIGSLEVEAFKQELGSLGLQIGDTGSLRVVVTDDYLRGDLDKINLECLAQEQPWMLVRPVGRTLWIGPLFRPGQTACWACLAQRIRSNRQLELFLERQRGPNGKVRRPSAASLPSTLNLGYSLAATEIAKSVVLEGREDGLEGTVFTLDTLNLETERHVVVRRPQCPACSERLYDDREPRPVVLQPRAKEHDNDGGHRSKRPDATLARLRHHVSPISGIVRNLETLGEGINNGLTHSYSAGHNFALMNVDLKFILQNLRGRAGGKGMTDVQAKVSAICEAIERYSGVYRGDEIHRRESFEELGSDAIHPNELMCFSPTQFDNRETWNKAHPSGFHKVPESFDEGRSIDWAPAYSLTHENFRWIPSGYIYFGHPDQKAWFYCTSDSNGCAAGNTIEEAILQGFFELVERDAVAMWWYNRIRRPAVDLDSFALPYVDRLREYYDGIGRDLWALDITTDLGVPTFAAVCSRRNHPVEDIVVGFGAHFDPQVALIRALTEINQFMPAVSRQDAQGNTLYWFPDDEALTWWKNATLERDPFLVPLESTSPRRRADFFDRSSADLRTDVELCLDLVARAGLEMLVVDQTQPDIGLSVVRVVVPGMRHFWKRFGRGRLYDVPVELGWLQSSLREDQLNPVGVFF